MNETSIIKWSGILDIIVGAIGIVGTLGYDLLMHRDWRLGIYAILVILMFIFYVIKGITQINLAD